MRNAPNIADRQTVVLCSPRQLAHPRQLACRVRPWTDFSLAPFCCDFYIFQFRFMPCVTTTIRFLIHELLFYTKDILCQPYVNYNIFHVFMAVVALLSRTIVCVHDFYAECGSRVSQLCMCFVVHIRVSRSSSTYILRWAQSRF